MAGDSVFAAGLVTDFPSVVPLAFPLAAFNGFDVGLCDVGLCACFADFRAAGLSVFRRFVPAFAAVLVPRLPAGADLEDFLRDFVDIRLPFVAFGGSIIALLRDLFGVAESRPWLGKSDGLGVGLQGIRRVRDCSLNKLLSRAG